MVLPVIKSRTLKRIYSGGLIAFVVGGLSLLVWYLHRTHIAVFSPMGPIARQERNLIVITLLLSLIVVIPVFALLAGISLKYRESNHGAAYTPNWDGNRLAETIWWVVPSVLIIALSIITWRSTHQLDPYKQIASTTPTMTIQAVALDWKWLFIYPEQRIATVGYVRFPTNTPIRFEVTSDAPMNSFWIPQLSGQIYAMAGMSSQLNLMADRDGSFRGSSSNISGKGFAGMTFTALAGSQSSFDHWVQSVKSGTSNLGVSEYEQLARPSENNSAVAYATVEPNLYNDIMMQYMMPGMQLGDLNEGVTAQ